MVNRIHYVAREKGDRRVTACGRVGWPAREAYEYEDSQNRRFEASHSPKYVTCKVCLAKINPAPSQEEGG